MQARGRCLVNSLVKRVNAFYCTGVRASSSQCCFPSGQPAIRDLSHTRASCPGEQRRRAAHELHVQGCMVCVCVELRVVGRKHTWVGSSLHLLYACWAGEPPRQLTAPARVFT